MADWIAVVDDDTANLKMAGFILSKNNMRVTALKSGRLLMDFVAQNKPDLVLLDILMPEMDGFETLRRLRESEGGKDIPVIFLTADEDEQSEVKGLELGAMDFIRKPFVPQTLVARVRHTVELDHLKRDFEAEVEKRVRERLGQSAEA